MRRLLAVLLSLLPISAQAAHPRAIMTTAIKARIKAKQQALSADWVALRGTAVGSGTSCDRITQTTAGTGDSLPPVYATREPVTSSPPGYITSGYQGEDYYRFALNLGTCYFGLIDDDPTTANKYKAQMIKLLVAMSTPFATLTPATPPASWGPQTTSSSTRTSRPIWYVTNTGPSGQARVNIYYQGLTTGAVVTISGVTGCTAANITGKVGATSTHYFDLTDSGGTPVICGGAGTNYNNNFASDAGYPTRFYVTALALGYDWFYADLSAGQRTQIFDTINGFLDEFRGLYSMTGAGYNGTPYFQRPMSNYHAGYFNALGLAGILTRGVGENSRGQEWYDYWHDTIYDTVDQVFHSRWLGNNGGFPEAMRYQTLSASGIALTLLAQLDANAEDLFASDFPWVLDLQRYWIHNTMPPGSYFSYRGYTPSPADPTGTNPNPWTNEAMWIVHHIADVEASSYRPKFKSFIDAQTTAFHPTQNYLWSSVVFFDSALSTTDYTLTEPLSLPQLSNPAGGYGRVSMRSDWTTSAVYGDIWSSPYVSDPSNGKERYDKGSIYVQRGDTHLLISPIAEATRSNSAAGYNGLIDSTGVTESSFYSLFYVKRDSDSLITTQYAVGQPGNDYQLAPTPRYTTTFPTRVDRYEDPGAYVYSRSVSLNSTYRSDATYTHYPVAGWEREMLYVRPGRFFVYDRTNKANKVTAPTVSYSQFVAWVTGKTPSTATYGSDMKRTSVAFGGTTKGALTYVKPDGLTSTEVDLGGFGIAYQTRVAPPSETQYVNWLTVVDAADDPSLVAAIAKFATHSNVDAISVGTDTVIGFASYQNGGSLTLPLTYTMSGMGSSVRHRIAGLAASTTYKRIVSGNNVTIDSAAASGTTTISTAAGVITFDSGAGADPPIVVDTSSPMPAGTVGVAYNQTLAGSGGNGGPYTWTKTAGTIPAGLSALTSGGVLAGTPTTANTYNFTVQICDSVPSCDTKDLSIVIAANPPQIVETSVPNGIINVPYSTTLTLVPGTGAGPFAWDISSGSLSPCTGMSFSAGGVLSGTPSVSTDCTFTARVTDGGAATDTQDFTLQVVPAALAIAVEVNAGHNSVIVRYGAAGLPYSATCNVYIKQGEFTVQAWSQTGPARRTIGISGLAPNTNYGALVDCATVGTGTTEFTTIPTPTAQTIPISWSRRPAPAMGASRLYGFIHNNQSFLQFLVGLGVGAANVSNTSCASGCTISDGGNAPGLYYIQWIWTNGSNVEVGRSPIEPFILK